MSHDFTHISFTQDHTSYLCGHPITQFCWQVVRPEADAKMWALIDQLPNPFDLSHQDFVELLRSVPLLWLNELSIQLDHCRIDLLPGSNEITLSHTNGQTVRVTVKVSPLGKGNEVSQLADTAFYLIDADSEEHINRKLAKMRVLGMIL